MENADMTLSDVVNSLVNAVEEEIEGEDVTTDGGTIEFETVGEEANTKWRVNVEKVS